MKDSNARCAVKKPVLMVCAFLVLATVLMANSPQFLWKPVSESNGNLVVLFPYQVRLESVQSISINDKFKPSKVTQDGANGGINIDCRRSSGCRQQKTQTNYWC